MFVARDPSRRAELPKAGALRTITASRLPSNNPPSLARYQHLNSMVPKFRYPHGTS
jgi:hypothetical protein